MSTIATVDNVRHAGNFSEKVSEDVLDFYLTLTSYLFKELIGSSNYAKAVAGSLSGDDNDKLKKAEALMTVGMALPAISTASAEAGILRSFSVGSRGELEVVSFVKEVEVLAAAFLNMSIQLAGSYVSNISYDSVWSNVVMRMFPSLDEMPTVALIGSEAEAVLKKTRGDVTYDKSYG